MPYLSIIIPNHLYIRDNILYENQHFMFFYGFCIKKPNIFAVRYETNTISYPKNV